MTPGRLGRASQVKSEKVDTVIRLLIVRATSPFRNVLYVGTNPQERPALHAKKTHIKNQ